MKKFDPKFKIPIQFHVRDDEFVPGSTSIIFEEFFKILDSLPNDAVVIWHHFCYDWPTLWSFISRPIQGYVSICARKPISFKLIKVFYFLLTFLFLE